VIGSHRLPAERSAHQTFLAHSFEPLDAVADATIMRSNQRAFWREIEQGITRNSSRHRRARWFCAQEGRLLMKQIVRYRTLSNNQDYITRFG
jgi:hypothetical protein